MEAPPNGAYRVLLNVVVTAEGQPVDVRVVHGTGTCLDDVAVIYLRRMKFTPAMRDGVPLESTLLYTYRFELE